jgi:hypothetical protein
MTAKRRRQKEIVQNSGRIPLLGGRILASALALRMFLADFLFFEGGIRRY